MFNQATKPASWPLGLHRIVDNILCTRNGTWAVFVAPTVRWRWRSDADRVAMIEAEGRMWAELTETGPRTIRRRTTSTPFDVGAWAQRLDELSPNAIREGNGGMTFDDLLLSQQNWLATNGSHQRLTYVLVEMTSSSPLRPITAPALPWRKAKTAEDHREALQNELTWITKTVGGPGYGARPATIKQVEWLLHRSIAPGLPLSDSALSPWEADTGEWESDDLYALMDGLTIRPGKTGQAVQYELIRDGERHESWSTAVTLGRMAPMPVPDPRGTWLAAAFRLGIPMEHVDTVTVKPGETVHREIRMNLRKVRGQEGDYRNHELDPPESLSRTARHAVQAEDETRSSEEVTASRAHGWYRFVVHGETESEAIDNARELVRTYRARRISAHITPVQPQIQRELIPGEPVAYAAHLRRVPMLMHAASMPQTAGTLGDQRGPVFGTVVGGDRVPVCVDTHYSPMVKKSSGLHVSVGRQGSGKSSLLCLAFATSILRGFEAVYLDPSVTAAGMLTLPVLKEHLTHINLAKPTPGILNPWTAVPEPRAEDYVDANELADERTLAAQSRIDLAVDVATSLLPTTLAESPAAEPLLTQAIQAVGGEQTGNFNAVLRWLRCVADEHDPTVSHLVAGDAERFLANAIADALEQAFSTVRGRSFMGSPTRAMNQRTLGTIITLGAPDMPSGTDRSSWTPPQRIVMAQLAVAAWLTARIAYNKVDRRSPVTLCVDETHFLADWSSGRALFSRIHRDTRKFNLSVWKASQNPADEVSQGIANHVAAVVVGRIEDPGIAGDALDLLGIERGNGYEKIIGGLSQPDSANETPPPFREYVYRDPNGKIDRMMIDFAWWPELLAAITTNAVDDKPEEDVSTEVFDLAELESAHDHRVLKGA